MRRLSAKENPMQEPLTLQILRIIQEFKSLPVSFLYSKLPASPTDIEAQVRTWRSKGR